MKEKSYKAYEYHTMMKIAYWGLPVLFLGIIIWFMFFGIGNYPRTRLPAGGGIALVIFQGVMDVMSKKAISIIFYTDKIEIAGRIIKISDIEHYYICIPLSDFFVLRLKTAHQKEILYIDKQYKEAIEHIMTKSNKPIIKINSDKWLYGHLVPMCLAIILIMSAVVISNTLL